MSRTRHQAEDYVPELPGEDSLVGLLRRRAAALEDKVAFSFVRGPSGDEVSLTYGDLHQRATAIAGQLQEMVPQGSRALLLFPPGLEFVTAFFGCLYAGVIAVPAAPPGRNHLTSSVGAIFDACDPMLILSTAEHCRHAKRSYAHLSRLLERPWVATDEIREDWQEGWQDPGVTGQQTAFLQYTSGSTSSPKGVMLSHENLLYNAALIQRAFSATEESRAVFWLPLYHDMGLIGGVIQPIFCGGWCTLLAPAAFLQRPALWLETIARTRANVSGGPDFAYDLCVRKVSAAERESLDLSSWEVAFTGAERIRSQTLQRFSEAFAPCGFQRQSFFPCYGLAEATLFVSGGPRSAMPAVLQVNGDALARNQVQETSSDDSASFSLVGCGEGLAGQRIVIADPQTRRLQAEGDVGEIWVQGSSVARGYYRRPEATAEAFGGYLTPTGEGPFLRTGDLGFLREGQLFVTGRLKDLMIIRGRNYYPEDIEHAVDRAHEALRPGFCAAFTVDVEHRERLVIVQEVDPRRRKIDTDEVLQAIRRAVVSRHELEVYAIALAKAGAIPKTSSGKTRRSECRQRFVSGGLETVTVWRASVEEAGPPPPHIPLRPSPQGLTVREIEDWLTQRIALRLQLPPEQVRVHTPFLEFGMGSIDAVEIAAELERWLGRRLSPIAVYNHPNIAALAQWLANPPSAGGPSPRMESLPLPPEMPDSQHLLQEVRQMTPQEMEAFIFREMAKQQRT